MGYLPILGGEYTRFPLNRPTKISPLPSPAAQIHFFVSLPTPERPHTSNPQTSNPQTFYNPIHELNHPCTMTNRFRARLLGLLLVFIPFFLYAQQYQVAITGPTVICEGDCATLFATTTTQPPSTPVTYIWRNPNGAILDTSKTITVCEPGTYTLIATFNDGASAADTHAIALLPFAPVQIVSNSPAACSPDSASTTDPDNQQYCEKVCPNTTVTYALQNGPVIGGTSSQVTWNVVGAQSFTVNPPFNSSVTVQWGATGSGSVSVVVFGSGTPNTNGCSGEDGVCVTIVEEPVAQFTTDPAAAPLQICKGQTVWFDNLSQYADTYEWLFSDDASITTDINPQHTFFNPGIYTVQLIARSACLCADTTTLEIEVLDAESPALDCVGDVCPGTTVTYSASVNCNNIQWNVSANGAILAGGTPGADSITVQWNGGPFGLITLSGFTCTGFACPQPTLVRVPVIDDNAEIRGPERVCPDAEEVYSIEPYGGTGFTWTLGSGGTITAGQGTHSVTVRWNGFPNPNTTHWLSVQYDNCYLGCGGQDSIPVRIVSSFVINGPVEACANDTKNFTSRFTYNNQSILCNWTLRAPDGTVGWTSAAPTATPAVPFANGPGLYRLFAVPDNPALSCSDQAEWAINVPAGPAAPTGIDGPAVICPGQTFTYTAAGLPPGASIRWTVQNGPGAPVTAGGNPINITWSPAGPYSLSAAVLSQDGLGCASAAANLNVQSAGNISIGGPAQVCINGNTVYTGPDAPGLALQWSIVPADAGAIIQGQGTKSIEVFWQTPGNHSIQLNVCGSMATQPVTVNPLPAPAVNHPASLCPGGVGTVQTTMPFTSYSWQNTSGTEISTAAAPDLGPGNYAVVVTDANGCSASVTFGISESPGPNLSVSTADPTAFCNNSVTVNMQALTNADGNLTYAWFQNGTPLGVNAPTYATNQYGSYTVQVTNPAGCTAVAGPILIIQDCGGGGGGGLPGNGPGCPPGSVTLQTTPTMRCDSFLFTAGGPLYLPGSAQWIFGQSGAPVVGAGSGDNTNFTFPNAGQYVVALIAQLTTGGVCRLTGPVTVEAAAKFDLSPQCPGTASGFEDLSTFLPGSGITAWNWNFGDPASGGANTSAVRNPTHVYTNSGPYPVTLQITANSGCTAQTTQPALIPAPPTPVIMAPAVACAGTTLTISAGSPDTDWNFGDPASGSLNTASGQTVYHAFGAGIFTITATATDVYGCTGTATVNLNVAANTLGGTIAPANPASLCEGNSLTLTAPAGGTAYLWSDSTTTANTLVVNTEGVYSVTLSDANGCTFAPPPVSVDVRPGPDATIKALLTNELGQIIGVEYPAHAVCAGEDVRLFVESPGGYTYVWSNGNTGITIEYSDDRGNLLGVGTHVFTVTVTDPASGCTAVTTPFVVTVNPVPSGFSISNNIFPACAGATNTLSYTGPNPGNWQYIWNTGQTDMPLVTTNPGVYFLRVINEFGCEVRSNPLTVMPGPNVLALPAGCHTRCKPDTLCLPPLTGITAWQWFFNGNPVPGATSPNFVAQQSGTYWAELTDNLGCANQSDPLTLNLLDGYGNILGQVWSDVNNNGVIDAGDTLVSGIPVNLLQGGAMVGNAQSGAVGDFAFTNILSTNYSVEIDAGALPANWQIVIGQSPATLSGCDAETQVGLLVKINCQTIGVGAVQLSACPGDSALYNGTPIPTGSSQNFQLTNALGCDSMVTVTVTALPTSTGILLVRVCPGQDYNYNGTLIPVGTFQEFILQNYLGCDSILTVYVSPLPTSTGTLNVAVCPGDSYDYQGTLIAAGAAQDFILQNYLGCDSVLTVSVGTLPVSAGMFTADVCPGSSYDYNGTLIPCRLVAGCYFTKLSGLRFGVDGNRGHAARFHRNVQCRRLPRQQLRLQRHADCRRRFAGFYFTKLFGLRFGVDGNRRHLACFHRNIQCRCLPRQQLRLQRHADPRRRLAGFYFTKLSGLRFGVDRNGGHLARFHRNVYCRRLPGQQLRLQRHADCRRRFAGFYFTKLSGLRFGADRKRGRVACFHRNVYGRRLPR
jgi:PKD repeat protein